MRCRFRFNAIMSALLWPLCRITNRTRRFRSAAASALILVASLAHAEDWPQWRGPHRDGVWREAGIIERFDGPEIALKWRVPISSGYSGPTVADGRVYVTDRVTDPGEMERVHCVDWKTGTDRKSVV